MQNDIVIQSYLNHPCNVTIYIVFLHQDGLVVSVSACHIGPGFEPELGHTEDHHRNIVHVLLNCLLCLIFQTSMYNFLLFYFLPDKHAI